MNNDEVAHAMRDASMPRRDFLRKSILLALPAAFGGIIAPAAAMTMSSPLPAELEAAYTPPRRIRGSATRNVRDYGAIGDDGADDTTAFQNAINSLPSDGGTVYVPAGNYKIDPVRSVKLRSRMHLQMHPDATLIAKPNGADRQVVLAADLRNNLVISGGRIIGEREGHLGTADKGGHCIAIRGCEHVTIRDVHVSKAWSAGISVGCKDVWKSPLVMSRDVVLIGVVSTGNRRNALAITNAVNVRVYDSEFSGTHGTKPQVGIDLEPNEDLYGNNAYCDQILIQNCLISDNARAGIVIWRRTRSVTIKNCALYRNAASGVFAEGGNGVVLTGNTISRNGANGLFIREGTQNYQVSGNISHSNYTTLGVQERDPFDLVGLAPRVERDILVASSAVNVSVGLNHYR